MKPDLKKISWNVDEATYREDPALSYSTLARFEREGFSNLDKLFDKIETPSLTFGSAVDALITGGKDEFDANFIVCEFPPISDSLQTIAKTLFNLYSNEHRTIETIPDDILAEVGASCDFYSNDKYKNYRVKLIKENCQEYYNIMYVAQGKKILDTETFNQVDAAVRALKESNTTKFFFEKDNPFDDNIQRYYQLKFKSTLNGVNYRCMADLIVVDHNNKTIQPIDLKTSGHPEWDFYHSFILWHYDIQARLYWRIIKDNISRYEEWKEYKVLPYKFIVVNKNTLTPLVWNYEDTICKGTLKYGMNEDILCRDPEDIGKELNEYLEVKHNIPINFTASSNGNSLKTWLYSPYLKK